MKFTKTFLFVFIALFLINISSVNADIYTLQYFTGTSKNSTKVDPAIGTISSTLMNPQHTSGQGVEVTAIPTPPYVFTRWEDGNPSPSRTDYITSSTYHVALFTNNPIYLKYTADPGGSVTGNTSQVVESGGNGTTVTAVPSPGYVFTGWSDKSYYGYYSYDNSPCEQLDPKRSDTMVTSNVSAIATFAKVPDVKINTFANGRSCTISDGQGSCNLSLETWDITPSSIYPYDLKSFSSVGGIGGGHSYEGYFENNDPSKPFHKFSPTGYHHDMDGKAFAMPINYGSGSICIVQYNTLAKPVDFGLPLGHISVNASCQSDSKYNTATRKCEPTVVAKPDLQTQIVGPQNPPTAGSKYEIKAGIVNTEVTDVPKTFTSIVQTATGFDSSNNPINLTDQPFLIENIASFRNAIKLPLRFDAGGNSLDGYPFSRFINIPTSVEKFDFRLCVDKTKASDIDGVIDELDDANNCTQWFNTIVCPIGTVWNNACVAKVITVDLTNTVTTVPSGDTTLIKWTSENATSCTLSGGGISGSGTSNTGVTTGPITSSTTFTVLCEGVGGITGSGSVTVSNPDLPNLIVMPSITPVSTIIKKATSFTSTIKNIGNVSTGKDFSNFFQIATASKGGGTIENKPATVMSKLDAGKTDTLIVSQTFVNPGTYSIRACTDKSSATDKGVIDEGLNEDPNCNDWIDINVFLENDPCGGNGANNPPLCNMKCS